MEMEMEMEMERKMPPAAGGDHPPRTPCAGDWVSGWRRGRGRESVGEAGIRPAMPSLRSRLAGQIPASQARRPCGASLKEFCFESLSRDKKP